MIKREPLLSEAYFDWYIETISQDIQKISTNMSTYTDQTGALFDIVRDKLSLLYAHYSRGYNMSILRDDFLQVVEAWEIQRASDIENLYTNSFKNDLTNYVESLGLLSLAHLLCFDSEVVTRLLACIRNEGEDLLFEHLVSVSNHLKRRKQAKKLLYPKAYQSLYDALNASPENQSALLFSFLRGWYKNIKAVGWHNAHKGPEGGGFQGYWCWEAAGIASALSINDITFRDSPYYPKDLADYKRTLDIR